MRKVLLALVVVAVIASATGCGAFELRKDRSKLQDVKTGESFVYTYLKDRLLDFWDIFGFKFHAGQGFLIHARATKLIEFSLGYAEGPKLGFKGRQMGYWEEVRSEFGLNAVFLITLMNTSYKTPLVCNSFMFDAEAEAKAKARSDIDVYREDDRQLASVGVCFFVGFFGFDIEVQLMELFDFLFGIATIDISKDDTVNRLRAKQARYKPESAAASEYPR